MTLLTVDEISQMVKLSRNYTLKVIVKQDGFPPPVIGKSKPRWDAAAVNRYLKFPQKANQA
jgi:predicted DNA-binding transcriptional regulator AlpA